MFKATYMLNCTKKFRQKSFDNKNSDEENKIQNVTKTKNGRI